MHRWSESSAARHFCPGFVLQAFCLFRARHVLLRNPGCEGLNVQITLMTCGCSVGAKSIPLLHVLPRSQRRPARLRSKWPIRRSERTARRFTIKSCFWFVLDLEVCVHLRTCSRKTDGRHQLTKWTSFGQEALRWHPDKHPDNKARWNLQPALFYFCYDPPMIHFLWYLICFWNGPCMS